MVALVGCFRAGCGAVGRDGRGGASGALLREAEKLLRWRTAEEAEAKTVDVVGRTPVTRRLYTATELAGFLSWEHIQTLVRVQSEKRDIETHRVLEQDRYFVCSLNRDALSDAQWLLVVRNHW